MLLSVIFDTTLEKNNNILAVQFWMKRSNLVQVICAKKKYIITVHKRGVAIMFWTTN